MNLVIGPLIIIAIMGLKSPSKSSCTSLEFGETSFIDAFKEKGKSITRLYDHWTEQTIAVGFDHDYFILKPYGFHILEVTG